MNPTQSTPLVKICGTTSPSDAQMAANAGADYLGIIIEHPPSPRSVSLQIAVEIAQAVPIPVVAVTVNLPLQRLREIHRVLVPAALQLHGDETADTVRALKAENITVWSVASGPSAGVLPRAAVMTAAGADAVLVDARTTKDNIIIYGGTGHLSDWQAARELVKAGQRVILAGGLTPQNVAAAIAAVQPWMVDVISGVEAEKGKKDAAKIHDFMRATRP